MQIQQFTPNHTARKWGKPELAPDGSVSLSGSGSDHIGLRIVKHGFEFTALLPPCDFALWALGFLPPS